MAEDWAPHTHYSPPIGAKKTHYFISNSLLQDGDPVKAWFLGNEFSKAGAGTEAYAETPCLLPYALQPLGL